MFERDLVKIYGRDKKGRFVSRRSVIAKKAYKNRVERVKKAKALLALFRDTVESNFNLKNGLG
ncbi:MAG: hypothetical protein QW514_01600 [Thermoprotei archaeon]